eukprot:GFKZ01012793.1.p1 GENE.GFKZ01012793.1~~GFKZ01012793.1.p1  ORF type:complete len:332 (+),score=34.94 GFKZ01012793.1:204-1199(+)
MDARKSTVDLEAGSEKRQLNNTDSNLFLEAAGLLTVWSLLVINEGSIRLNASQPAAGLSSDGRPPNTVLFLGGLFEVFFGLLGLFLGLAAFIRRYHSTILTKAAMVIQTVLGYYVFIVFVFVAPIFGAIDLSTPFLADLNFTDGQDRFFLALGIMTSFHFCLALQGGQFVFMARLVCGATGQDFLKQRSGSKMRAVFWNANMGLAGLWTLITGVLLSSNHDSNVLDSPYFSPPNIGRIPGMTTFTGVVMMVWAVVGITLALRKRIVSNLYFAMSALLYLIGFLNYALVQITIIPGFPSDPIILHAGLIFMTVFLGPYFVHLSSQEEAAQIQ